MGPAWRTFIGPSFGAHANIYFLVEIRTKRGRTTYIVASFDIRMPVLEIYIRPKTNGGTVSACVFGEQKCLILRNQVLYYIGYFFVGTKPSENIHVLFITNTIN